MISEGPSEIRIDTSQEAPFGLDIGKFSSVTRLQHATALLLRCVNKLRKKANLHGPLDATEIANAEELLTVYVQRQQYSERHDSIRKSKSNKMTGQLGIYINSCGLVRWLFGLKDVKLCESARQTNPSAKMT